MRTVSASSVKESPPLISQLSHTDDFIKNHPVRNFFCLNVIDASSREIKLEIEAREQVPDCRSEVRAALGCVIDYAARSVGESAITNCELLEYEVTLRGEVRGGTFLVHARLVTATDDVATYHCFVYGKLNGKLNLIADSQGTLVKRISG